MQVFRQSDLTFVRILDAIRCFPFPAGLLSVGDDLSRTAVLCCLRACSEVLKVTPAYLAGHITESMVGHRGP